MLDNRSSFTQISSEILLPACERAREYYTSIITDYIDKEKENNKYQKTLSWFHRNFLPIKYPYPEVHSDPFDESEDFWKKYNAEIGLEIAETINMLALNSDGWVLINARDLSWIEKFI